MHTTACVEKLSQFCLGQTSYLKPKGKAGLTNKREEIEDGSKKSVGKKMLSNNRYQEKEKKKASGELTKELQNISESSLHKRRDKK